MLQHCHYLINLWSTAMRKRKKIITLATNAFHLNFSYFHRQMFVAHQV
jgi:hypothetical protein